MAIASANEICREYGLAEVVDPGKRNSVSSFFSSLNTEFLMRFAYEDEDELRKIVDRYLEFYNFKRVHSGLKYKVPLRCVDGGKVENRGRQQCVIHWDVALVFERKRLECYGLNKEQTTALNTFFSDM